MSAPPALRPATLPARLFQTVVARLHRRRIHYAWIITAVTFLVLLVTSGIRSTPGLLILPLEREFGWTRITVSTAVSINLLLYGLVGPFAASLMDRFGVRRVIVGSVAGLAVAQLLMTLIKR